MISDPDTFLPVKILVELTEREAASPDVDWTGVVAYVARSYQLARPGGVIALVLPDGKPFIAKRSRT